VHLDLNDPLENIVIPNGVDVVINTAAHFGGKEYEHIYQAENVNVQGVLKLCKKCLKANVKHFVNISSTSAYLTEDSEYFGIYALSKKQSDELVKFFCSTFNLPYTILRPSQLYGNDDSFRKHQPFLYTALDKAERSEDIGIYGAKDALRNYIHINDFTKLIALVVINQVEGLYACTHAEDVSLSQIAHAAIQAFGTEGRVIFQKNMADIPDNIFLYDDALYKRVNFFPQISIEEGMKRIATYRLTRL